VSVFSRFAPRLQQAIVARLGWSSLRPVQEEAGEALLGGMNAVILAPTAGGKTEAAMFPTLSGLVDDGPDGVGALYVAPLKALLNNQAERLGTYTEMVGLSRFVWHGDTPESDRRRFLAEPAAVLMTTPESLEVMLVSQRVDASKLFADLRVVIIDEVHAVAGTDRGAHLLSVVERIARLSRHDLQRVGLSATVGNPAEILAWLQGTSRRPGKIVDPPKQPGRKQLLVVHRPDLVALARDAAGVAKGSKSLFFCQSRAMTEAVAEQMSRAGTTVFVHHSAVSRDERARAEEQFHRGSDACIVCTSTLELGIDVGDLDHVLQAEAPDSVGSFLQRMGRTGRREGQVANTTFFCQSPEGVLQAIALVELAKAGWVEDIEVNERCWPVLVHQLLAMSLAEDGIPPDDAWAHLSQVPDFKGIHRAEYQRLIDWMLRDRSLVLASGRLVLGPKAERRFGRRNFIELYAVFTSPQSYTVQTTAGQELGSLNQAFVDRLVDGLSCFLLSGRPWVVLRIQHDDRRVVVERAPHGRQPTWGGFLPQFLSLSICQKIRDVLASGERFGYLEAAAAAVLHAEREENGAAASSHGTIEDAGDEIRWWTFAGGRINSTLRHALEAVGGAWSMVSDNFCLKARGADLSLVAFRQAVAQISELEFWENERLWQDVAGSLPSYRLSKFQPLMPPWVEREMVAAYLLDVAGAWRWLSGTVQSELRRVPAPVAEPTPRELEAVAPVAEAEPPPVARDASRPIHWVDNDDGLKKACAALEGERVVGLDVETTLRTRALCLIQIAGAEATYLIDALEVTDLSPLETLLASPDITKLIHNAVFERSVLGRYGLALDGVVDTLVVSRRVRGRDIEGGHGLQAVCQRELGIGLDQIRQTSDWTRRPLTEGQVAYAALDAEVLPQISVRLGATCVT
jgi:ATP-dependent Lhr-like helicase